MVDTAPLIFLAKLDRLYLLQKSADEILVPPAVVQEVNVQADEATQKIDKATRSWLQIQEVHNKQALDSLLADLDPGEAEVIALAKEISADRVVLDDLDARRFARRIGLPSIGTLGLLLAARLRGEIVSLTAEIDQLRLLGFWASDSLVEAVLRAAQE